VAKGKEIIFYEKSPCKALFFNMLQNLSVEKAFFSAPAKGFWTEKNF